MDCELKPYTHNTTSALSISLLRLSLGLNKAIYEHNHPTLTRRLTQLFKDFIDQIFGRPKVCPIFDICHEMVQAYHDVHKKHLEVDPKPRLGH